MTDIGDRVLNVRRLVDDVASAVDFYTTHLGFSLRSAHLPAFVDVTCGHLRLLLAEPTSSAARPMPDGRQILLDDPAGHPIELFTPAAAR